MLASTLDCLKRPSSVFVTARFIIVVAGCVSVSCASAPPDTSSPPPSHSAPAPVSVAPLDALPRSPIFDVDRASLSSFVRSAGPLPLCTGADLTARSITKRLSTIEESELTLENPHDLDWRTLTTGRFHRADFGFLHDYDERFGIVFAAEEKRHTTLGEGGFYFGRGILVDTNSVELLCSFPTRFRAEDDTKKSFIELFQVAIDAAALGPAAPRVH
jgi:hypothetical protein